MRVSSDSQSLALQRTSSFRQQFLRVRTLNAICEKVAEHCVVFTVKARLKWQSMRSLNSVQRPRRRKRSFSEKNGSRCLQRTCSHGMSNSLTGAIALRKAEESKSCPRYFVATHTSSTCNTVPSVGIQFQYTFKSITESEGASNMKRLRLE